MAEERDWDVFEEEFPSPEELKKLSPRALEETALRVRELIIRAVELNGGHLASNLGVVELTIALHFCFDFSRDRLLFDVGHQAYAHKILTGRAKGMRFLRNPGGVCGFTAPDESPYDVFTAGHAGSAVSIAAGMAAAYAKRGEGRRVVALVGDAAMQNGMSLEAMNHAGSIKAPLLVVLNDNEMSISATVGAISGQISRFRTDRRYLHIKDEVKAFVEKLPMVGQAFEKLGGVVSDAARRALSPGAIFELMGFRYYGPVDGHDVGGLIGQIENIKDIQWPALLHVVTKKGRGQAAAEKDPAAYHSAKPLRKQSPQAPAPVPARTLKDVSVEVKSSIDYLEGVDSYSEAFGRIAKQLAAENPNIAAITAAMEDGTGLSIMKDDFPDRVFDVGIAESHAVGFAAGLAAGGLKPIVAIYSTFMQRAVDQVFQEFYLQNGLGVVIAMDRAGVVGGDGPTHQGAYDITCFGAFPGVVQMGPRDAVMLEAMLRLGLELDAPCCIRYPKAPPPAPVRGGNLACGKAEVLFEGELAAVFAYGAAVEWALDAREKLKNNGVNPTVVDVRFGWPLDTALLGEIAAAHDVVVSVEDGIIEGGVGRRIAGALAESGALASTKMIVLGIRDARLPHAERDPLLNALGLNGAGIADVIMRECR